MTQEEAMKEIERLCEECGTEPRWPPESFYCCRCRGFVEESEREAREACD